MPSTSSPPPLPLPASSPNNNDNDNDDGEEEYHDYVTVEHENERNLQQQECRHRCDGDGDDQVMPLPQTTTTVHHRNESSRAIEIAVNEDEGEDRKPASASADVPHVINNSSSNININRDQRFVCAICLETVSDEPVVTQCGHLYCWPCLYQWLRPGMTNDEYYNAFGTLQQEQVAGSGLGGRVGLNFMHQQQQQQHHHLLHGGRQYQQQHYNQHHRRCCPVCKSGVTVDSVIPIYIHVHELRTSSSTSSSSRVVVADAADAEAVRFDSSSSSSSIEEAEETKGAEEEIDVESSITHDKNYFEGQRQQRRHQKRRRPAADEDDSAASHNANRSSIHSVENTPVHRNTSRGGSEGNNEDCDVAPSRPTPISPWRMPVTTISREASTIAAPASSSHRPPRPETSIQSSSSSPFRLALRPRQQSPLLSTAPNPLLPPLLPPPPPPARQRLQQLQQSSPQIADGNRHSQTLTNNHHHHQRHQYGRLTSALLMIVDAIENNIGAATSMTITAHSRHDSGGGGSGGGATSVEQDGQQQPPLQPALVVPPLHRSDGGLGGIRQRRRAPESERGNTTIEGESSSYRNRVNNINEEDLSMAVAREFLSRLVSENIILRVNTFVLAVRSLIISPYLTYHIFIFINSVLQHTHTVADACKLCYSVPAAVLIFPALDKQVGCLASQSQIAAGNRTRFQPQPLMKMQSRLDSIVTAMRGNRGYQVPWWRDGRLAAVV